MCNKISSISWHHSDKFTKSDFSIWKPCFYIYSSMYYTISSNFGTQISLFCNYICTFVLWIAVCTFWVGLVVQIWRDRIGFKHQNFLPCIARRTNSTRKRNGSLNYSTVTTIRNSNTWLFILLLVNIFFSDLLLPSIDLL